MVYCSQNISAALTVLSLTCCTEGHIYLALLLEVAVPLAVHPHTTRPAALVHVHFTLPSLGLFKTKKPV